MAAGGLRHRDQRQHELIAEAHQVEPLAARPHGFLGRRFDQPENPHRHATGQHMDSFAHRLALESDGAKAWPFFQGFR